MTIVQKLARKELLSLKAYSSARNEQSLTRIALDANENPFACDNDLNRYPEPRSSALYSKLADLYGVTPETLLITRGSDEAIDLLIRAFCEAGKDKILITPPTYGMYAVSAGIQNAKVTEVTLGSEEAFALPVEKILNAWDEHTKLIFLCSPNNPTASVFSRDSIIELCKQLKDKALVVVDEAYIEFSDTTSLVDCLADFENLVVLRTLSKAYGLAGLRCGTVLASDAIIKFLQKIIAPYPIPSLIGQYIVEQLNDNYIQSIQQQITIIRRERESMLEYLQQLAFVTKVWPSQTNFILFSVTDSLRLREYCFSQGITVRDRSQLGLGDCIRLSMGTVEQNNYVKEVLSNATI